MHGHIKALNALGDALAVEQDHVTLAFPTGHAAVKTLLEHLARGCHHAAEALEKEELALLDRIRAEEG